MKSTHLMNNIHYRPQPTVDYLSGEQGEIQQLPYNFLEPNQTRFHTNKLIIMSFIVRACVYVCICPQACRRRILGGTDQICSGERARE